VSATGSVNIGGSVSVAGSLIAGGNLSIGRDGGTDHLITVDSLAVGGILDLVNVSTIQPYGTFDDGTPVDLSLTVGDGISSVGAPFPVVISNGLDADPENGRQNPGNGGLVTLNITNGGLTIDPAAGDLASVSANGGMFASNSTLGGNGGMIDITAPGDITLNVRGNLIATSGDIPSEGPSTIGNGGTINVTSIGGAITVSSTIQASSDDSKGDSLRRSSAGGNINLTSHRANAEGPRVVAVNLTNTGQLLSLLDPEAPGPGGQITILGDGANSDIRIKGQVEADRGTIDIRHLADGGKVSLSDATISNISLRGDIIKVGALSANGLLTDRKSVV